MKYTPKSPATDSASFIEKILQYKKMTAVLNLIVLLSIFFFNVTYAQQLPILQDFNYNTPQINTPLNRISNSSSLNDFFIKLNDLKRSKRNIVKIVHIGDSHIQADILSGVLRYNFQLFFGNAGRGLVFPYQLSKSSYPQDIFSKSTAHWDFNRVAHPEIQINPGVSGFVIQTNALSANIEMSLNNAANDSSLYFKRLVFFIDTLKTSSWLMRAGNNVDAYFINNDKTTANTCHKVVLAKQSNSFLLTAIPTETLKSFYGVSLENDKPGILYHTIGVNGARYDQFNKATLFWKQLPILQADLFIISLGTNEAQKVIFNESAFITEVSILLDHIKNDNPNATVLITTAPDSFKGSKPNFILSKINLALANYCADNNIPLWNLYNIVNGYGAAYKWVSKGLMTKDRVHFTNDGYRLQGQLLFNALAKGYNEFINR